MPGGALRPRQLPQHERQDSSVAVVLGFLRSVHADIHGEALLETVIPNSPHAGRTRSLLDGRPHPFDVEHLLTGELQAWGVLAGLELQGQNAHPCQVGTVDALEALRDHRAHA